MVIAWFLIASSVFVIDGFRYRILLLKSLYSFVVVLQEKTTIILLIYSWLPLLV